MKIVAAGRFRFFTGLDRLDERAECASTVGIRERHELYGFRALRAQSTESDAIDGRILVACRIEHDPGPVSGGR